MSCVAHREQLHDIFRMLMLPSSPFAEVKTRSNEPQVHPVYCPISGRFSFSYDIDDGTESVTECSNSDSRISNCPLGFGLHLSFNGCAFRANFSKHMSMHGRSYDFSRHMHQARGAVVRRPHGLHTGLIGS